MAKAKLSRTHNSVSNNLRLVPDFDPEALLKKVLQGRPIEEGISVDGDDVKNIDDGIQITEKPLSESGESTGWTIKVYIADMPAMVPNGSGFEKNIIERFSNREAVIDQFAKRRPVQTFPQDYIFNNVSLHQDTIRPVIAFNIDIGPDFDVKDYTITRAAFRNIRKCNLTPLHQQMTEKSDDLRQWYKLAYNMQDRRLGKIADDCDRIVENITVELHRKKPVEVKYLSAVLVQEIMRLTNVIALEYVIKNGLETPAYAQPSYIDVLRKGENDNFNRASEAAARDILRRYGREKPDKIRLSSPMLKYADFVTLKIIVDHIDSGKQTSDLVLEARRLSSIFGEVAQLKGAGRRADAKKEISYFNLNPFNNLGGGESNTHSRTLIEQAKNNGWACPDVSIHRVTVPGGYAFLVGVEQKIPEAMGGYERAFGVALTHEEARELAAYRLNQRLFESSNMLLKPSNQPD